MFRVIDVVQSLGGDLVTALELSLVDVIDDVDDACTAPVTWGEPVVRGQRRHHVLADRLQFGDRQWGVPPAPGP